MSGKTAGSAERETDCRCPQPLVPHKHRGTAGSQTDLQLCAHIAVLQDR
jgi:hypothetical protein